MLRFGVGGLESRVWGRRFGVRGLESGELGWSGWSEGGRGRWGWGFVVGLKLLKSCS